MVKELNLCWKMFAGSDFPIAIEQTRLDRTLREMRIPRSKSQREMKQMVELAIKKFRVRWETFEGIKPFNIYPRLRVVSVKTIFSILLLT